MTYTDDLLEALVTDAFTDVTQGDPDEDWDEDGYAGWESPSIEDERSIEAALLDQEAGL